MRLSEDIKMSALTIDKGFLVKNLKITNKEDNDIIIIDTESENYVDVVIPLEIANDFVVCLREMKQVKNAGAAYLEPFYKVYGEETTLYVVSKDSHSAASHILAGNSEDKCDVKIHFNIVESIIYAVEKLADHLRLRTNN